MRSGHLTERVFAAQVYSSMTEPAASTTKSNARLQEWLREFTTIVLGVMVALAADSLWDEWKDRQQEAAYVEQLRADVTENTKRINAAIALEKQQHEAANAAYNAVSRRQTITRDSAEAWLITRRGVYYSDPRLLTGTVTELVSTGDLRLLRNSAVRQAVATYATQIREDRDEFNRFVQSLQPPFEALRTLGFQNEQAIDRKIPFSPVVAAVTGTPGREALAALDGVLVANEIRLFYLQRMQETTDTLRKLLEVR
jgi:hypothetical protein